MSARTDCRSNLNFHVIDNVRLAAIDEHMEEAKVTFSEAQEERNKNVETLKEVKGDLQEFQKEHNLRMLYEFIACSNQIFRPCFYYYHKQSVSVSRWRSV